MNLLKLGATGSVVAAICCFTPILVILLTAIGAASIVGYLDYVLIPSLIVFIAISVYAFIEKRSI